MPTRVTKIERDCLPPPANAYKLGQAKKTGLFKYKFQILYEDNPIEEVVLKDRNQAHTLIHFLNIAYRVGWLDGTAKMSSIIRSLKK